MGYGAWGALNKMQPWALHYVHVALLMSTVNTIKTI